MRSELVGALRGLQIGDRFRAFFLHDHLVAFSVRVFVLGNGFDLSLLLAGAVQIHDFFGLAIVSFVVDLGALDRVLDLALVIQFSQSFVLAAGSFHPCEIIKSSLRGDLIVGCRGRNPAMNTLSLR